MASKAEPHTDRNYHLLGLGLYLRKKSLDYSDKQQDSHGEPSQPRISRISLRLSDSHFSQLTTRQLTPGEVVKDEASRWSCEYEIGRNNDSDNELELEEYIQEVMEDKLERHRRFFQGEPLMRCLKGEEDRYRKWIDTLFYDNLYHEVQHGPRETRSQKAVRAYWKKVREKLTIDDSEIEIHPDLDTEVLYGNTHSSLQLGSVVKSSRGWKRPAHICLSSGKDLELQELRSLWIDRRKTVGRAATFGKVEVQEAGNSNPLMLFGREDLGRAATFG
ncbi:hypothetical protein IFR05_014319 [Cadophora sp. M221]|nr:hypothetical protein IFR05_014319 [Cadophora sp. M221]